MPKPDGQRRFRKLLACAEWPIASKSGDTGA